MRIGNLDGRVINLWQVVYDSGELSSAQTTFSVTGLTGDTDDEYIILSRIVNGYNGTTSFYVRPNNDSTAGIYGRQYLQGSGTSSSAARSTGNDGWGIGKTINLSDLSFSKLHVFSTTGDERTAIAQIFQETVVSAKTGVVYLTASSWNETTTEITSLMFRANQTDGFGVGSRVIVLRKSPGSMRTGNLSVVGDVEDAWQKVYESDLAAAATSVTISGLDGDTDCVYKLLIFGKSGANASSIFLRLNNDSGANYGKESISAADTVVTVAQATAQTGMYVLELGTLNRYSSAEIYVYGKSGYGRQAFASFSDTITGTTVNDINFGGYVWDNTADNVTSIVLFSDVVSGLGIDTHIELYKLNL